MDYADAVATFCSPRPADTPLPEVVRAGGPARRLRDACEPLAMHALWNRRTNERLAALGLDFITGYVGGRAASLGEPSPPVVAAAFAWFEPNLLAGWYEAARSAAPRERLLAVRDAATAASLHKLDRLDGHSAQVPAGWWLCPMRGLAVTAGRRDLRARTRGRTGGYLTCASPRSPPALFNCTFAAQHPGNRRSERERKGALHARRWRIRISSRRHLHQGQGDQAGPGWPAVRRDRGGQPALRPRSLDPMGSGADQHLPGVRPGLGGSPRGHPALGSRRPPRPGPAGVPAGRRESGGRRRRGGQLIGRQGAV